MEISPVEQNLQSGHTPKTLVIKIFGEEISSQYWSDIEKQIKTRRRGKNTEELTTAEIELYLQNLLNSELKYLF